MPLPKQEQSVKAKSAQAAQDFLAVDTIRDGIITLKNGGLRKILMTSSLNFALKSADEQDAIIFQYQNFINAVDFSLQFVVQSRKLNITPYLQILKEREKEEANDLLKVQISEYREFIRSFVELSNVVSKAFYIVIPFNPTLMSGKGGLFGGMGGKKRTEEENFLEYKTQIDQRVDAVSLGLIRFGIRTAPLNTEELIELFYGLYNPGELGKEKPISQETVANLESAQDALR
ncbi:MAG: hypothetical protein A3I44_00835 [Candidatus Sungbacteria bacterium RIFCSPLOWO2_02_FULL_51_17]|nr:MAG: hypothetical protein A2676_05720 [Candidatus Sungbacteria bacterium RIFCSPHIGHO2_01_FULL_51_22]OHA07891.1 MAG: hypothetical protein A3B29_01400 [Candidatus Sungbacteria bacterium RIFCSPLOWO2_01_FULL_51_34]OHA10667.1 MAG: hypothetical protein A3I44_00835 [Candidatus Sungbacteria bacterium RIFCSPLOWO2_02_FULL_51_17]